MPQILQRSIFDDMVPLSLPMKLALRWLSKDVKQKAEVVISMHLTIGKILQDAFLRGGGSNLESSMFSIHSEIQTMCFDPGKSSHYDDEAYQDMLELIKKLHLRPSDFSQLLDGWNVFFVRQRYRDDRQRETILLQLVSKPLSLILGYAGVENCNLISAPYGHGIGLAEMTRRFWPDTQQGRIYLSETEINKFNVDLSKITEFTTTPELRTALIALREKALIQMSRGYEAIKESNAPRHLIRSLEQFQIYEELSMERAQKLNFRPSNTPIGLSRIKTYRLFWFQ